MSKKTNFVEKTIQSELHVDGILNALKNERYPLILWGCGEVAECVCTWLKNNNITLADVFIDIPLTSQIFHDIKVCNLDDICKKHKTFDVIVGHLGG